MYHKIIISFTPDWELLSVGTILFLLYPLQCLLQTEVLSKPCLITVLDGNQWGLRRLKWRQESVQHELVTFLCNFDTLHFHCYLQFGVFLSFFLFFCLHVFPCVGWGRAGTCSCRDQVCGGQDSQGTGENLFSFHGVGSEDRSQVLMLAWCQVLLFLRHFTNPSHFFGVESHVTEYHLEFVVPSSQLLLNKVSGNNERSLRFSFSWQSV